MMKTQQKEYILHNYVQLRSLSYPHPECLVSLLTAMNLTRSAPSDCSPTSPGLAVVVMEGAKAGLAAP